MNSMRSVSPFVVEVKVRESQGGEGLQEYAVESLNVVLDDVVETVAGRDDDASAITTNLI